MEKMKCPMCDTSDFKDDNGYYVCQICGHKIAKENAVPQRGKTKTNKTPVSDKGADKIISLVIFSFIALSTVLSILPNLEYYLTYGITNLSFSLFCVIPMVCFAISTIRKMQGRAGNTTGLKTFGFVIYAIGEAGPTIINIFNYFNITSILYTAFYIALVWVAVYKLEKWIKK